MPHSVGGFLRSDEFRERGGRSGTKFTNLVVKAAKKVDEQKAAKKRKKRLPKLMNRLARLKGSSLLAGRSGGLQTSLLAGGGISSMQTSILGG